MNRARRLSTANASKRVGSIIHRDVACSNSATPCLSNLPPPGLRCFVVLAFLYRELTNTASSVVVVCSP